MSNGNNKQSQNKDNKKTQRNVKSASTTKAQRKRNPVIKNHSFFILSHAGKLAREAKVQRMSRACLAFVNQKTIDKIAKDIVVGAAGIAQVKGRKTISYSDVKEAIKNKTPCMRDYAKELLV